MSYCIFIPLVKTDQDQIYAFIFVAFIHLFVPFSCPLSHAEFVAAPTMDETGVICILVGAIQIAASCTGAAEDADSAAASSDSMASVASDSGSASAYSNMGAQ